MPDRPSRRRRDDDDDRPRLPRARRDYEDDRRRTDDDDRPRSRRREDDDRPSPRKRRDDEVDRPRKRRGRRLNPLWIILPVGGVVALLVLGVLLYVFVLDGGKGGPPSDMLAWAPADTSNVTFVEYGYLRTAPGLNGGPFGGLNDLRLHGLDPGEVASILRADGASGAVTVFKTTGPIDRNGVVKKLARGPAARPLTADGKTYYEVPGEGYVYFPAPNLLVAVRNQKALTDRLGRDDGKVVVSGDVRRLLGRVGGHAYSVAINRGGIMTVNGDAVRAKTQSVRVANGQVERTGELDYEDSAAAQRAYDQIQAVAGQQPGVTTRASKSGSRLTVTHVRPLDQDPFVLQEFLFALRW